MKKKTKIIYVIRNYKDITVSLYNFMRALKHYNYDGSWEDWLELHLDEKCKEKTPYSLERKSQNIQGTNQAIYIFVIVSFFLKARRFDFLSLLG